LLLVRLAAFARAEKLANSVLADRRKWSPKKAMSVKTHHIKKRSRRKKKKLISSSGKETKTSRRGGEEDREEVGESGGGTVPFPQDGGSADVLRCAPRTEQQRADKFTNGHYARGGRPQCDTVKI
jgi:hypothetical protein